MNGLDDIRHQLEWVGSRMFTAAIAFMILFSLGQVIILSSGVVEGGTRQVDFVALWAAAKLAIAGDPAAAFDQETLRQVQSLPPDADPGELYWRYPAAFHILIMPLGLLPYYAAWLLFNLISLYAFAAALWRRAAPVPMAHSIIFCAPIILIELMTGQVSLLWSAVLIAALSALQRDRLFAAGFLIAMLSLKPQLGILIPVALVAAGQWRVILWASFWVLIMHGAATVLFGTDYWVLFFGAIAHATDGFESGETNIQLMFSPYAFMRFIGFAHTASMAFHWLLTVPLAVGLFVLWKQPTVRFDLKVSALWIAILLATPYSFFYELVLSIPAAIFLVRGGIGATNYDRVLLALLIFGPAATWFLGKEIPVYPLFAPLLMLIFGRCLVQAFWPLTPERAAASSIGQSDGANREAPDSQ